MTQLAKLALAVSTGTPIDTVLAELYANIGPLMDGHLADYIPELAKADPRHFGIVIATAEGGIHTIGDCDVPFTIQSISKAFVYGLALEERALLLNLGRTLSQRVRKANDEIRTWE